MAMRLVSRSTFSLPSPSFTEALKSGKSAWLRLLVSGSERRNDLLVDLVVDSRLALQGDHGFEIGLIGDDDGCVGSACVLVADILDEEQLEDLVLVLAGVHTSAELITARSEGAIEFPFCRHAASLPADYGASVARRQGLPPIPRFLKQCLLSDPRSTQK